MLGGESKYKGFKVNVSKHTHKSKYVKIVHIQVHWCGVSSSSPQGRGVPGKPSAKNIDAEEREDVEGKGWGFRITGD